MLNGWALVFAHFRPTLSMKMVTYDSLTEFVADRLDLLQD